MTEKDLSHLVGLNFSNPSSTERWRILVDLSLTSSGPDNTQLVRLGGDFEMPAGYEEAFNYLRQWVKNDIADVPASPFHLLKPKVDSEDDSLWGLELVVLDPKLEQADGRVVPAYRSYQPNNPQNGGPLYVTIPVNLEEGLADQVQNIPVETVACSIKRPGWNVMIMSPTGKTYALPPFFNQLCLPILYDRQ